MVNPGKEGQLGPSTKKQHDMSSAADKAYTKIRTAILTGELGHGENLSERELGLRIGLSRTPVREAINRLRIEGLVLLERNSRNFVARFSGKDVEEILGLKAILEGHAATLAASRITETELGRLNELATQMEKVVEDASIDAQEAYYPLNDEFHNIIIRAADSRRLELMLNTSLATPWGAIGRFRSEAGIIKSFKQSCAQHRKIIAALESRDPERANAQMHSHFLTGTSRNLPKSSTRAKYLSICMPTAKVISDSQ